MKPLSTALRLIDVESPWQTACLPPSFRAELISIDPSGRIHVRRPDGTELACDWLESPLTQDLQLIPGDILLVAMPAKGEPAVVIGRIGRYQAVRATVTIQATESLTLQCGQASVDLRADGKVMVKGEDVLLRATGTQRIRAGKVAIN